MVKKQNKTKETLGPGVAGKQIISVLAPSSPHPSTVLKAVHQILLILLTPKVA